MFGVSLRGWLRSSDRGCGFEDPGPVRPEDCFPVPSLSVVRGGASASPAGREFEIAYRRSTSDNLLVMWNDGLVPNPLAASAGYAAAGHNDMTVHCASGT